MADVTEQEIDAYVDQAMKTAVYDEENGEVFASIPDLPGVWGAGENRDDAAQQLRVAVAGARYLRED